MDLLKLIELDAKILVVETKYNILYSINKILYDDEN